MKKNIEEKTISLIDFSSFAGRIITSGIGLVAHDWTGLLDECEVSK